MEWGEKRLKIAVRINGWQQGKIQENYTDTKTLKQPAGATSPHMSIAGEGVTNDFKGCNNDEPEGDVKPFKIDKFLFHDLKREKHINDFGKIPSKSDLSLQI